MSARTPDRASPSMREHTASQQLIRDAMLAMAGRCMTEDSLKLRPGHWLDQRQLYSLPLRLLPAETIQAALPPLLDKLAISPTARQAVLRPLEDGCLGSLHYLHLGIEQGRCKIYWEAPTPAHAPPDTERFVLYRSWKWFPGEEASLDEYVLLPSALRVRQRIEELMPQMPVLIADLLEQLEVSFALQQQPWPPLSVEIESVVQGRQGARDSLNLHVHSARLPLGVIAGLMLALAREWQVAPRQQVYQWLARHGGQMLSNISFGLGEDGEPFFTCYYGGRAVTAAAA